MTILSNFHRVGDSVQVSRACRVSGSFERVNINMPGVVEDYNKYVGGVNKSDQL